MARGAGAVAGSAGLTGAGQQRGWHRQDKARVHPRNFSPADQDSLTLSQVKHAEVRIAREISVNYLFRPIQAGRGLTPAKVGDSIKSLSCQEVFDEW
jgi:muramidase (phage lysozyme)